MLIMRKKTCESTARIKAFINRAFTDAVAASYSRPTCVFVRGSDVHPFRICNKGPIRLASSPHPSSKQCASVRSHALMKGRPGMERWKEYWNAPPTTAPL